MFFSFFLALAVVVPSTRATYIEQQLVRYGLTKSEAKVALGDKRLADPLKLVTEERVTWTEFERRLLAQESVANGASFLLAHNQWFMKARAKFSVPPEVIASLIRVETELGGNLGQHEVYKLLYQRAVSPRYRNWSWAAINFASLAGYCKAARLDCFALQGSREGALGLVQFLPYNIWLFGVDADGDGVVDLQNPADAVLSAARFLYAVGWQKNRRHALARYYGSSQRYPEAVLRYAQAVSLKLNGTKVAQRK